MDFTYEVSRSPGRVRGRAAARRRLPGRRGPDRRQHLPGGRLRAGADPGHEQGRPPGRRARARGGGDRRPDRRGPRTRSSASPPRPARASTSCWRRSSAASRRRTATPTRPPRALIFDSEYDQYRGVIAYIRVVDGTFTKGETIRAMANQTEAEIDDIGFFTPAQLPAEKLVRRRGGLPDHRPQGRHEARRRRHPDHQAQPRPPEPLPGYRDVKPMVFCGLFPMNNDDYPELRDALEKLELNDAALSLGARDLRRARLRLPLRLPRPAAHGHRARAPGARVRPRADGDDALRRVRGHADRRRRDPGPQPDRHARPGADRRGARALHPRLDPHAEGVHRADHGALPGPPRRAPGHALPLLGAREADLRPAAGGDRARLLRPAQDPHARLREPRLRADRPAPERTSSSSTCCSAATRSTR